MFVGHYGPALAGRALRSAPPLWALFIGVQLVDVFWSIFVLTGIEKVRIVPGITASNPLDLYYMPYTHSLAAGLAWSLIAGVGCRLLWPKGGIRAAAIMFAAVFSHWLTDLLVHRPDLPLLVGEPKVGLGLWNYPFPAFCLEMVLLLGGAWLYRRSLAPAQGLWLLVGILVVSQLVFLFMPPPPSDTAAAITALAAFLAFAGGAWWIERRG